MPRTYRPIHKAGHWSAPLAGTGSAVDRRCPGAWDVARGRTDHGSDLGAGGGRHIALPLHQAGHQLLRTVQLREELSRQDDAHAHLQAAQQAYPAGAGGGSQETATGRHWPWPGRWWLTCWPWKDATQTSCLPASSSEPRQRKNPFLIRKREKHQEHAMRRLPGPADYRLGDGGNSRGSLRMVSGLAENTNSIFCNGS